jgi:hypothetical protein
MTVLVAIETIVLALLTVLVAGLLRSHAEILRRLHEMGAGLDTDGAVAAPMSLRPRGDAPRAGLGPALNVAGVGLVDDALHVAVVGVQHRTLLAFLSTGCLTCHTFWEAFADADGLQLPDDVRVVVVTKDATEESVSTLRQLAPPDLPVVLASEAWDTYRVPGSPYFVLVDGASGQIAGEGTGVTWPQVHSLLTQATNDAAIAREDLATSARIDRELLASGIGPGHPSLYPPADDANDREGARA